MSSQPDPYKILGVSKDAQLGEIRSAHRKLVLKCHPDKIQDPTLKEEKQMEFQQVQQAYETLSNDKSREDYDRQARIFAELARERERATRSSATRAPSSTRTPRRAETSYYDVNIKTASPRANTFAAKGSPYTMRDPPRSYEDNSGARLYEELGRHARKTASYEKERPSRKDDERRRRKEDEEMAREKERAREKEKKAERKLKEEREKLKETERRDARAREKEEKKKAEKEREREREKQRKRDAVEKEQRSRRYPPVVEAESSSEESDSDEDDVVYEAPPAKSERQKSGSTRPTEDVESPLAGMARERKMSGNMEAAFRYLARSGGKPPGLTRAQTLQEEGFANKYMTPVAAPTPPPALQSAYAPPPPPAEVTDTSDSDVARRSAARASTRRMSHDTPKASGAKPTHKKSSSSRDGPIIIDTGSPRIPPTFQKSHSERHPPHRSNTDSFTRSGPMPVPLSRADTWYARTEREQERHERSRSRPTKYAEDTESEDEREQRHRRSGRRTTHSPEPMVPPTQYKYTVEGGKTTRQKSYHAPQEPPARSYKSSKGNAYITPNSSSSRSQRAYKSYDKSYDKSYPRETYEDDQPQQFFGSKVKYATQFKAEDINYSKVPYSGSYRSDVYAS